MRKEIFAALAILTASSCPLAAYADVIGTFDVTGTFANHAALNGQMTIDETSGVVNDINLSVGSPTSGSVTTVKYQGIGYDISPSGIRTPAYFIVGDISSTLYNLILQFPQTSLVGFSGGPLASSADPVGTGGGTFLALQSLGTVTSELNSGTLTPVPEPSSFALLGSGLLGLGFVARRKRRRA